MGRLVAGGTALLWRRTMGRPTLMTSLSQNPSRSREVRFAHATFVSAYGDAQKAQVDWLSTVSRWRDRIRTFGSSIALVSARLQTEPGDRLSPLSFWPRRRSRDHAPLRG